MFGLFVFEGWEISTDHLSILLTRHGLAALFEMPMQGSSSQIHKVNL